MNCMLCDGDLTDRLEVKGYGYYLCRQCGSYTQHPAPTAKTLDKLSGAYHRGRPPNPEPMSPRSWPRKLKNINMIPDIPPPASILEIGCGTGTRMQYLKALGYNVCGVELSPEAAYSASEYGVVYSCPVGVMNFRPGSFDIIIMSMVLEHLENPKEVLKKVHSWLSADGELWLSVPCADGIEFKLFKEYCYAFVSPFHVFIPSFRGLRRLLSDFHVEGYWFQVYYRDLLTSLGNKHTKLRGLNWCALLKKGVQMALFVLTGLGMKTSRVTVKCVKAKRER